MRADLLDEPPEGINVGIFWEAPTWVDKDYYGFLVLQRLFNDKPEHELEAKIIKRTEIFSL